MRRKSVFSAWSVFLALFTCAPRAAAAAPQWVRTYGGVEDRAIQTVRGTADGGFVTIGRADRGRLWLMKLAGTGNVSWEKSYEIQGLFTGVEEAPDGGFVVAASTTRSDAELADVLIMGVGPSGVVRWQKAYGGTGEDNVTSVRRATDGNYLIVATTSSFGISGYQPWLVKIDPQGEILWQRRYGSSLGGPWFMALDMETTPDGGCIVAADDNWLLKLDADGNPQWQKRYPHVGFGQSRIESIRPAPGGGYVAAGYKPPRGESNAQAWIMRLDEQGNVQWQHGYRFGEVGSGAREIVPAPGGEFLVAGEFYAESDGADAFLMMVGAGGEVRWAKAYQGGGHEELTSVQPAGEGFIAAGSIWSAQQTETEGFILRVGPDGQIDECPPVRQTPVTVLEADAVAAEAEEAWTPTDAESRVLEGAALVPETRMRIACADPARLTVLRPNGGESLPAGGNRSLAWRAPPDAVDFNLAYSLDWGRTWRKVAWHVPGPSHVWSVPIPADNRRRCLVKVRGIDSEGRPVGFDRSDSTFTIQVVELTQPSGQYLEGGTAFRVRWDTFGTIAPVRSVALFFSPDGGATWGKIIELAGNPGAYVWRVPQMHTSAGLIRVRLKDQEGRSVGQDDNDRRFWISLKP